MKSASAFDIYGATARAQLPDAWSGYFDVKQSLTERICKAMR